MAKVKQIGYDAVQLSALGPIDPQQLKDILDQNELTVAATHVPFDRMRDEPDAVIAEHKLWGCHDIALGGMTQDYRNPAGYTRFAAEISAIAKPYVDAGLRFSYHNHSFEFEHIGGKTVLETIFDSTDPALVQSEMDLYWVHNAGADPAQWLRKLAGRVPIVHLKDMAVYDNVPTYAEIGEGNMNYAEILKACADAGVEWHIVEQDTCRRSPFDSFAISLANLHKLGMS